MMEVDADVGIYLALCYKEQGHFNEAEALEVVVLEKRKRMLSSSRSSSSSSSSSSSDDREYEVQELRDRCR